MSTNRRLLAWLDAQSGVTGATGTVWTIAPDGHWTKALFFNERSIQPPKYHGTLSHKRNDL